MAEELRLSDLPYKGFVDSPVYDANSDSFFYQWENTEYFADRVNGLLTVYRSMDDERVVGVQIKGLRKLIVETFMEKIRAGLIRELALSFVIEATRIRVQGPIVRYRPILQDVGTRRFSLPAELQEAIKS